MGTVRGLRRLGLGDGVRTLSIDIPWGNGPFVGFALGELTPAGTLSTSPLVASVPRNTPLPATAPPAPLGGPEAAGFIADGAGPGRATAMDEDRSSPFLDEPHSKHHEQSGYAISRRSEKKERGRSGLC